MGNSVETKEKILDTAINHFARRGFNAAKTADIAKDAGVSEGTVFKYFSTKKDILTSVLNRIVHEIVPWVLFGDNVDLQGLVASKDPRGEIKSFLLSRINRVNKNISAFKILVNELPFHEDIMREYTMEFVPGVIRMGEGFYRIGVEKGVFRDINPHTAARSFIGMIVTIVLEYNILKNGMDLDKELDTVLDIYMNGVSTRKEG